MQQVGYNLGIEFLRAQDLAFRATEDKILARIDELSLLNEQNRDLQKLVTALTRAKQDKSKKTVDFSDDIEMQHAIDRIHQLNPEIFGTPVYIFRAEEIETTLTLLDNQVKDQVTRINTVTMYINQDYQERVQYTENAQKTLDMLNRHTESIIRKQTGR
jgi:hypothetical protein